MPTIPDAPPAIIPRAAVGASRAVVRESTAPPIRQRPSVAAETSSTGSQEPARALSASACR